MGERFLDGYSYFFFVRRRPGQTGRRRVELRSLAYFFLEKSMIKECYLAAPLPLPDSIPCSQAGQDGGIVDRRRPEFESRRGGFLFLLFLWRRAGHTGRRRKELRCRPILTTLSAKKLLAASLSLFSHRALGGFTFSGLRVIC